MSIFLPVLLGSAAIAAPANSPQAARAVVQRYYAALDRGDYRTAYRSWGRGGEASGQRYAQFVHGFARTRHTSVAAGAPGPIEGAAGSSFIRVPVTVRATLKDGSAQRFTGSYTLRRVNDVDGATAEQRRWHIDSASLRRQ